MIYFQSLKKKINWKNHFNFILTGAHLIQKNPQESKTQNICSSLFEMSSKRKNGLVASLSVEQLRKQFESMVLVQSVELPKARSEMTRWPVMHQSLQLGKTQKPVSVPKTLSLRTNSDEGIKLQESIMSGRGEAGIGNSVQM